VARRVKRLSRYLVKDPYRFLWLHGLFDGVSSFAELLHEQSCLVRFSNNLADLSDRSKYSFEIVRISDEDGDVVALQLICEHFELGRSRDEYHLRLQSNYSLETGMERVAHFSNRFCFGGEIAIAGASNQPIARADSEYNLTRSTVAGRLTRRPASSVISLVAP
jgi:hypothetical protein